MNCFRKIHKCYFVSKSCCFFSYFIFVFLIPCLRVGTWLDKIGREAVSDKLSEKRNEKLSPNAVSHSTLIIWILKNLRIKLKSSLNGSLFLKKNDTERVCYEILETLKESELDWLFFSSWLHIWFLAYLFMTLRLFMRDRNTTLASCDSVFKISCKNQEKAVGAVPLDRLKRWPMLVQKPKHLNKNKQQHHLINQRCVFMSFFLDVTADLSWDYGCCEK